jgi:hypothetical protein
MFYTAAMGYEVAMYQPIIPQRKYEVSHRILYG